MRLFKFFVLLILAVKSYAQIDRVEPPNWWVGMEHNEIQILFYGDKISELVPRLRNENLSEVFITKTTRTENQNYLFVDLTIVKNTKPQTLKIDFLKNGKIIQTVLFELFQKDPNGRLGFDKTDVLYLITPDRFANGDPSNDYDPNLKEKPNRKERRGRHGGDIQGMIDNLDYISDMGYTAIWINPVLENDMADHSYHGYSTTDYYKVDSRFGTNELYRDLCRIAKSKGIKIVMDMITNHSGSEHWFVKDPPTRDWINYGGEYRQTNHSHYTVQDPYASEYDKKAFVDGWFVRTMPDLNHRNEIMAKYLTQNTLWWIEYSGISGIRMDTYPYNDKKYMTDWSCAVKKEYPYFTSVGEEATKFANPSNISYWQEGKINHDGYESCLPSMLDFAVTSAFVESIQDFDEKNKWKPWQKLYYTISNDYLYADPFNLVTFPDNHDGARIFSKLNEDLNKFKMAMVFFSTMRGIPHFYYGSEILMSNKYPTGIRSDFPGGWPGDKVNGFTGIGLSSMQKEAQLFIKKLLNWRKNKKVIHYGNLMQFAPTLPSYNKNIPNPDDYGVYTYFRYNDEETVMVMLNNNKKDSKINLEKFNEILGDNNHAYDPINDVEIKLSENISVPANSALILELISK